MKIPFLRLGTVVVTIYLASCATAIGFACPHLTASPAGVYIDGRTSTLTYDGEARGHTIQFSVYSGPDHPGSVSPGTAVTDGHGDCTATYTSGSDYGVVTIHATDVTVNPHITTGCTVTVFRIDQSSDLWYFNGASPANFPIEVTLTALGTDTGTFVWNLYQDAPDKAFLVSQNNLVLSVTRINNNTVNVRSVGPSAPGGPDVHIDFGWNLNSIWTFDTYGLCPTRSVRLGGSLA